MNIVFIMITMVILIWSFLYTTSFGNWTWKNKNRSGAVMVYVMATSALALPAYVIFFR